MTDELKNAAQVCDDFAAPDMAAALRGQPAQAVEVDQKSIDWHAVTLSLDEAHDESLDGRHGVARAMLREVCANIRASLPTQPAAQATHDEDETTLRDVDPKADAFLANQQATPEPVGGQPGQAFYEAHAFAFDHRFPWESLDASVKNRYAFAESMLAKAYAARHTHAAASGRGPFGQVTVRRLSQRHANHVDQYQFYPAGQSPYLDNVDECHTVYTHPAPGVPEGFSTTPPTEQGWYWHWNGDEDSRPIPTSVLRSGATGTCFVSMGQLGLSEAIDCDKYGGYWLKLNEPWDALTAAQAKGADHG